MEEISGRSSTYAASTPDTEQASVTQCIPFCHGLSRRWTFGGKGAVLHVNYRVGRGGDIELLNQERCVMTSESYVL